VLFGYTPEVSDQIKGTIDITRPTQIVFTIQNGNKVGANTLAVVTANISFGLSGDTQVSQRLLEDLSIGHFGAKGAEVGHKGFLL
jgi:hypothetical protein